jgi:galactoside O-acetyltransferase
MNDMEIRMAKGQLYDASDPAILEKQTHCLAHLRDYNSLTLGDEEKMKALLPLLFASVGQGVFIQPPFYANWGGAHVHLGDGVYANYNLTLVDDGNIFIGSHTMIGPNVTLATAAHPIDPTLRAKAFQYNKDIHLGENVWLGAGVIVLPGVTIGKNSVIGAGSVVTKDIPENVVAVGSPCHVLRPIGEHDKEYFYKDEKIDL